MKTYLHVGFHWVGEEKIEELEPVFDLALSWIRYAPNCWIVWTSSSPGKWYRRLKPYVGDGDHLFICELNINNRQGWLPTWAWDWIRKQRV